MIITRRRFVCGGAAIGLTGTVVAKAALPRLLPAPGYDMPASPWTIGLLGKDGRELVHPEYKRLPLVVREAEDHWDLVPVDGRNPAWHFAGYSGEISGWGVWTAGVARPVKVDRTGFPATVVSGTLTLTVHDPGYVVRFS